MSYCCVPGCTNTTGGHKFPKDPSLRKKWRIAVNRIDPRTKQLWEASPRSVVCHNHFREKDYRKTLLGEKRCLIPGAVPTQNINKSKKSDPTRESKDRERELRLNLRRQNQENINLPPEVAMNVTIGDNDESASQSDVGIFDVADMTEDASVQCSLLIDHNARVSIENYVDKPELVHFWTGFENYGHFMLMFQILGPASYSLSYTCKDISPQDQFFLTCIKLRRASQDMELAEKFQIGMNAVSKIVKTWIMFISLQLSEIDTWLPRSVIDTHMPKHFGRLFKKTRVILDGTEIPIVKPSNVTDQAVTFSTYKNRNTLKNIIGISPRGVCTYVSDSYGGSASDRQILERSSLKTHAHEKFDNGDDMMGDRGLLVQDLFAIHNVRVNTPTMLNGKSQLEPNIVVKDRRIASKRIHVERVIGLGKTYRIIKEELPYQKIHIGGHIIRTCFLMSNFRPSIIGKQA